MENLTETEKKRLTTWIVSQHRAGAAVPAINDDVLDAVARGRDMAFSERVDEAVLFFTTRVKVGGAIVVPVDVGDPTDLYKQLKERIGAVIGDGPKRRTL